MTEQKPMFAVCRICHRYRLVCCIFHSYKVIHGSGGVTKHVRPYCGECCPNNRFKGHQLEVKDHQLECDQ